MEQITNTAVNGNTFNVFIILFFIGLFIIIFSVLIKNGLLRVKTKRIELGRIDKTREIIRRQIEFAKNAIQEFIALMPIPDDDEFNEYKAKYAAEKVFDEVVNWISFNHISTNEFYVKTKQVITWNIIQGITEQSYYKTEEFRKSCDELVAVVIEYLVKIRDFYKGEKENG